MFTPRLFGGMNTGLVGGLFRALLFVRGVRSRQATPRIEWCKGPRPTFTIAAHAAAASPSSNGGTRPGSGGPGDPIGGRYAGKPAFKAALLPDERRTRFLRSSLKLE